MAYVRIEQSSHEVHQATGPFGDKTFIPNLSIHGFSSEPDTYIWTLGTAYSNYTESKEEWSKFSISVASGGLDEKHLGIRVQNIRDGEAVFIPISITVSKGGESASYSCKTVVVMGSPRSTPITISGIKNGRLIYTKIYQDAIERRIKNAELKNSQFIAMEDTPAPSIQDMQLNIDEFTRTGKKTYELDLNSSADRLYQLENEVWNLKLGDRRNLVQGSNLGMKPLVAGEIPIPMYYEGRSTHETIFNSPHGRQKNEEPAFIMPYNETDKDPCAHNSITTKCDSYNCEENECGDTECTTTTTTTTQSLADYCADVNNNDHGNAPMSNEQLLEHLDTVLEQDSDEDDPTKPKKLNCKVTRLSYDQIQEKINQINAELDELESKKDKAGVKYDEMCPKPGKTENRSYRTTTTVSPSRMEIKDKSCHTSATVTATTTATASVFRKKKKWDYYIGTRNYTEFRDAMPTVEDSPGINPYVSYPHVDSPRQNEFATEFGAAQCLTVDSLASRVRTYQQRLEYESKWREFTITSDPSCFIVGNISTRAVIITAADGSKISFTNGHDALEFMDENNIVYENQHPMKAETSLAIEGSAVFTTSPFDIDLGGGWGISVSASLCKGNWSETKQPGATWTVTTEEGSNGPSGGPQINRRARQGVPGGGAPPTIQHVPPVGNNPPRKGPTLGDVLRADPVNAVVAVMPNLATPTAVAGNDSSSTNDQRGGGMVATPHYEPPSYTQGDWDYGEVNIEFGRSYNLWSYRAHTALGVSILTNTCPKDYGNGGDLSKVYLNHNMWEDDPYGVKFGGRVEYNALNGAWYGGLELSYGNPDAGIPGGGFGGPR